MVKPLQNLDTHES